MRPRLTALALPALAAAILSCSDTTRPPGATVQLYVTMASFDGPNFAFGDNGLEVSCDPHFRAVVTGTMAGSWVDAKVLWYVGTDRTRPADSTIFTKSEMAAAWGSADLIPGDTLLSDWSFANTLPFRADFVLRYKGPSGPVLAETVGFTCGPAIDSATPAPSVDVPTVVSAPPGDLSPGDTIVVRLAARAPAGLWQTSLRLAGACADTQFFSERLATENSHTAQFVLRSTCALGQQLDIVGGALDGAGRIGWATLSTGRNVVDRRPPTVTPNVYDKRTANSAPAAGVVRQEYFTGDSVILDLQAQDNVKLSRFYWEETTSGRRDSLAVSGTVLVARAAFYLAPGASATPHFRFWARDAAGLTSDTVATPPGAISVAPRVTPAVRMATIDGDVADGVYDAKRQVVYFAERNAGRVDVLSIASMTVVSQIALGTPVSVDLVPSGDSLVVALLNQRELAIVDLTTATPTVTTVALTAIDSARQAPFAARAMANGKVLVALGSGSSAAPTLLTLDLATGAQRVRSEVTTPGATALTVTRTADATVAVVGGDCLRRYSAAADAFSACVNASGGVVPAIDASGSVIADALTIFDGTPALVRQIPTWRTWPSTVGGTALTADGATLLIADPDLGIVRVRTSDGYPVDASALPFPTSRLLLLGSDRSVVAWNGPTTPTSVVVVNLP